MGPSLLNGSATLRATDQQLLLFFLVVVIYHDDLLLKNSKRLSCIQPVLTQDTNSIEAYVPISSFQVAGLQAPATAPSYQVIERTWYIYASVVDDLNFCEFVLVTSQYEREKKVVRSLVLKHTVFTFLVILQFINYFCVMVKGNKKNSSIKRDN